MQYTIVNMKSTNKIIYKNYFILTCTKYNKIVRGHVSVSKQIKAWASCYMDFS